VKLWSSTNLTEWKFMSLLITPSKDHWYKKRFWAPELFPYKGKWYLTFNCPVGEKPDSPQSVGLAVADRITGPYRVLTEDRPLTEGNDATLFQDDDGKVYLFRSGISAIQVDLEHAKTVGASFNVIAPGPDSAWDGTAPGGPQVGLEGPSVLKHGQHYYLLYASWGRGYEAGYASASKITGPWLKYRSNPIYGAQDEEWSKIYKHEYTQAAAVPYGQLGHGSPFVGPDGALWFGCHGYLKGKGQEPHLVITPLNFDHDVVQMTVTWTPQVIFLPRRFRVRLGDARLASPDFEKLAAQP
jgi:beta-xylosidase